MSAVATAFIGAVMMFLVLLCALGLLKELLETISSEGIPVMVAVKIFAYQIPGMLVYAFPMAVLLGILMTFSGMSSSSEMVAIRAAGVSFIRIVVPVFALSLVVLVLTFYVSNSFAPYASKRSQELLTESMRELKKQGVSLNVKDGATEQLKYHISSPELNMTTQTMFDPTITYFDKDNKATAILQAEKATWDEQMSEWVFHNASLQSVKPGDPSIYIGPIKKESKMILTTPEFNIDRMPSDLDNSRKDPANFTSDEIREYLVHLKNIDGDRKTIGKWSTRLVQRYSLPFTCIVFTLIGASLGLRHHRTSNAVGLGISIIVIFVYYFIAISLSTLGDGGTISPYFCAWAPIVLGLTVGIFLLRRANR